MTSSTWHSPLLLPEWDLHLKYVNVPSCCALRQHMLLVPSGHRHHSFIILGTLNRKKNPMKTCLRKAQFKCHWLCISHHSSSVFPFLTRLEGKHKPIPAAGCGASSFSQNTLPGPGTSNRHPITQFCLGSSLHKL